MVCNACLLNGFALTTCLLDLIFKNQAATAKDKQSGQFVNDLLRTEFHRCVSWFLVSYPNSHRVGFEGNLWESLSRWATSSLLCTSS